MLRACPAVPLHPVSFLAPETKQTSELLVATNFTPTRLRLPLSHSPAAPSTGSALCRTWVSPRSGDGLQQLAVMEPLTRLSLGRVVQYRSILLSRSRAISLLLNRSA